MQRDALILEAQFILVSEDAQFSRFIFVNIPCCKRELIKNLNMNKGDKDDLSATSSGKWYTKLGFID